MSSTPFNLEFLQQLDAFGANLHKHITVISFTNITPDLRMLTFRTTGKDDNTYFFAWIEFDFMKDIARLRSTIEGNFSRVIEFIPPMKPSGDGELDAITYESGHGSMKSALARTERPQNNSYWATYIKIMPGNSISERLASLPEKDAKAARDVIQTILNSAGQEAVQTPDPQSDSDINTTSIGMHIYKNPHGDWEAFYNRVS